MKKVLIAILSLLLVYSFFQEYNVERVLVIIAGAAAGFAIFRLPQRYVESMKYPLIVMSFMVTVLFFFYPKLAVPEIARMAIVFVSFYAFIFYLTGMEEKNQDFFKEVMALSILFFSSGFNLYITGRLVFMISFAAALILFLFIIGRHRIIPFIAAYAIIAAFMVYRQGSGILGSGLTGLSEINRYILLGASFALLATSFALIMKKSTFSTMLPFLGFLYIAMDILLVVGIRFSTGLLYQPVLFVAMLVPLAGTMLKGEGGRS
ncbi:MAG: hypothetical protein PHC90_06105 [Syntrophorhabdaceae bacterium]|nr:hypothetical protein [Syntrophorhabdaceae bacterium]